MALLALTALVRRAVTGIAGTWDDIAELEARRALWIRPWDHHALHWSGAGAEAVLPAPPSPTAALS